MKRRLFCGILATILLGLTGCAGSLPAGDSGSIALVPFFDRDLGIGGVVPVTCSESAPGNFECPSLAADGGMAVIVQQAYPGPRDELVDLVLSQVSLEQLPEAGGHYRGRAFNWDLYSLEVQVKDAGPDAMHVELALAEGDATSYFVALVTPPEVYEAHPALFETVFGHAVYGLVPWE
ncbi:MAG: hypothetical protein ACK2UC_08735 [Anaerolineae bacterium]